LNEKQENIPMRKEDLGSRGGVFGIQEEISGVPEGTVLDKNIPRDRYMAGTDQRNINASSKY